MEEPYLPEREPVMQSTTVRIIETDPCTSELGHSFMEEAPRCDRCGAITKAQAIEEGLLELHVHIDWSSQDCDGRYSGEYVIRMEDEERAGRGQDNYFGDIEFHNRVVGSIVNTYSLFRDGVFRVRAEDEYGPVTFTWDEPTEEGGRSVVGRFCTADCTDE